MTEENVRRPLTLADAMILAAALAPALKLAMTFADVARNSTYWRSPFVWTPATWPSWRILPFGVALSVPFAAAATLAALALRLVPPRASRRRLARQPGWAAIKVATLLGLVGIGLINVVMATKPWLSSDNHLVITMMLTPAFAGSGVAASWLTLRWTGRPRRPIDWVERMSRALG